MQFKRVRKFILNKLKKELPLHLSYHSIHHITDVYGAAENIAREEGISGYEQKLLLTAALFHDSGFLIKRQGHEAESCNFARSYLPDYNYMPGEIERICGMIMATKIPQEPHNQLEQILGDADLDYLGRDDFFTIGQGLFAELCNDGIVCNEQDWNKLQVAFMETHHYHTKAALKLRQAKKNENINLVRSKI